MLWRPAWGAIIVDCNLYRLPRETWANMVGKKHKGCGASVRSPYLPYIMEGDKLYIHHHYIAIFHGWSFCGEGSEEHNVLDIYALCHGCAVKAGVIW